MIIDYAAIGLRVKRARININMTQQKLAEKSGFSVVHISNIENGNAKLSLEAVVNIANALAVSADDLLCDNLVRAFHVYNKEVQELFADCSTEESRVLVEGLQGMKSGIRKNKQLWEKLLTRKDD